MNNYYSTQRTYVKTTHCQLLKIQCNGVPKEVPGTRNGRKSLSELTYFASTHSTSSHISDLHTYRLRTVHNDPSEKKRATLTFPYFVRQSLRSAPVLRPSDRIWPRRSRNGSIEWSQVGTPVLLEIPVHSG